MNTSTSSSRWPARDYRRVAAEKTTFEAFVARAIADNRKAHRLRSKKSSTVLMSLRNLDSQNKGIPYRHWALAVPMISRMPQGIVRPNQGSSHAEDEKMRIKAPNHCV